MNDFARWLDRGLPDRHAPRGLTSYARFERALADDADHGDRVHVLGHDLAGEEVDAGHFDMRNGLGRSEREAADPAGFLHESGISKLQISNKVLKSIQNMLKTLL